MIFSGNRYRTLVRDNKFSADFDLSFANTTGKSQIGFSGDSKIFSFSFLSGKIFDHEGRYFSSYIPNNRLLISTNFSGASYNYEINQNKVLFSGAKDNFYVDRFFINTTGCNVDASISILGDKPSLDLILNPTFVTGSSITGYFVSNSLSGVKIFSGAFDSGSNFYFQTLPAGFIRSGISGAAIIKQIVTGLGDFITSATFETSAGTYNQDIEINGVEKSFISYAFRLDSNNLDDVSVRQFTSGIEKVGSTDLVYSYDTNDSPLIPESFPIDISLSYHSGATGSYGQVASISVVNGGFGYLSSPTIIFSGGLTGQQAEGSLLSVVGDYFIKSSSTRFDFPSGERIRFWKKGSNILPSPLQENFTYYVVSVFSGEPFKPDGGFQISTTSGGSPLDITTTGSGSFYYYSLRQLPSATAILGSSSTNYSSVTSVKMNSYGSGYTSAPIILFSGNTGNINNQAPISASGLANMAIYNKSFTGFFNLYTGYAGAIANVGNAGNVVPSTMTNYRTSSFISGNKYVKTGVSIPDEATLSIFVTYTPSFDSDPMVSKLVASGINGNVIEKYITGVK